MAQNSDNIVLTSTSTLSAFEPNKTDTVDQLPSFPSLKYPCQQSPVAKLCVVTNPASQLEHAFQRQALFLLQGFEFRPYISYHWPEGISTAPGSRATAMPDRVATAAAIRGRMAGNTESVDSLGEGVAFRKVKVECRCLRHG